jgi:hypothetical protein
VAAAGNAGTDGTTGEAGNSSPGNAGSIANTTNLSSVITGGQSYPVTVAPGGFVTISWTTQ